MQSSDEATDAAPRAPGPLLRPLARSDVDLYRRLYTDPMVMAHIAAPLSSRAARKAFDVALSQNVAIPPRARYWVVCIEPASQGCGIVALKFDAGPCRSAETGILLEPSFQGRGLASGALAILADQAFATFPLERLWTRHRPDNQVVVRLMEALEFNREPIASVHEVRWSMGRAQWLGSRRSPGAFARGGSGR